MGREGEEGILRKDSERLHAQDVPFEDKCSLFYCRLIRLRIGHLGILGFIEKLSGRIFDLA